MSNGRHQSTIERRWVVRRVLENNRFCYDYFDTREEAEKFRKSRPPSEILAVEECQL